MQHVSPNPDYTFLKRPHSLNGQWVFLQRSEQPVNQHFLFSVWFNVVLVNMINKPCFIEFFVSEIVRWLNYLVVCKDGLILNWISETSFRIISHIRCINDHRSVWFMVNPNVASTTFKRFSQVKNKVCPLSLSCIIC
jgi:hypothetical protein